MAAVLGDVRADWRDLDYLMPERRGVVAGERGVAVPAGVGPQLDNRVWG